MNIVAVALAVLLAATGCKSTDLPRDLMAEEARTNNTGIERPVAMRGEGSFLEGKLKAMATVSRGFDRGSRGPVGNRRGGKEWDMNRPNNRRDDDAGFTQVYSLSEDSSDEERKEVMEDYIRQAKARRAAGSPMPPVTLRVLLENKGTEPLEVEVTEVNSDLGNFAVRPPKLTIAPGATGTLDPMVSQLGVMSDEIPLKLALRSGGKKENQVLIVKNVISNSLRKEFEKAQRQ
jgi:hypothetical protein